MSLVELTEEDKKEMEKKKENQKFYDDLFRVNKPTFCKFCGAIWTPNAKYCIKCGKKRT